MDKRVSTWRATMSLKWFFCEDYKLGRVFGIEHYHDQSLYVLKQLWVKSKIVNAELVIEDEEWREIVT